MSRPPLRVLAVDWSGDARAPHRKIWIAEVVGNELVGVRRGGPAKDMAAELTRLAGELPLIVGLDFAFSFPAWFVKERLRADRIEQVWDAAAREGEDWLRSCEPPFWGRPEKKRPARDEAHPYLRVTEAQMPFPAKSVFQVGGGGAVGTGSIRGMPLLKYLHESGFRIWPFADAGQLPLAIEIYPRVLTRAVVKSDPQARREYLERDGRIPQELFDLVASEEDPFDAAVSALEMAKHSDAIRGLERQPAYALEGAIWQPEWLPGRRYLDPGLPDEPFVFDYPNGTGEGPFRRDETLVEPDGTVIVTSAGTPRVLRIVDVNGRWLVSRDGQGKRWRLAIRRFDPHEEDNP